MISSTLQKVTSYSFNIASGAIKGCAAPILAAANHIQKCADIKQVNIDESRFRYGRAGASRARENVVDAYTPKIRHHTGIAILSVAGAFASYSAGINPVLGYLATSATLGIASDVERKYFRRQPQ